MKFRFGTASGEEVGAEQLYIDGDEFLQKLNAQVEKFPIRGTSLSYDVITVDINSMDDLEVLLNRFDMLVMYKKGNGLVEKYSEIIWADVPVTYENYYNDCMEE